MVVHDDKALYKYEIYFYLLYVYLLACLLGTYCCWFDDALLTEAAEHHGDDVDVLPRLAQAGVHHRRTLSELPSPRPHRSAAA